jgi:hypothetical protein
MPSQITSKTGGSIGSREAAGFQVLLMVTRSGSALPKNFLRNFTAFESLLGEEAVKDLAELRTRILGSSRNRPLCLRCRTPQMQMDDKAPR